MDFVVGFFWGGGGLGGRGGGNRKAPCAFWKSTKKSMPAFASSKCFISWAIVLEAHLG